MPITKRFIAGAVCPRCGAMDKIRAWENNGIRYKECVSCDFFEQLAIEEPTASTELETRVNRKHNEPISDEIKPVRIIAPAPGKKGIH
ncbi:YheV family putative zinc ribbon protein [Phytohalomonas tamaricis]|uniref:YheV family putative zinc ribbon protein n=1 Tax=Phytohalomonas tamaricis TaxID=2081032 RepID=UPI000D0AC27D|nr:YheV family putative zinc ribbon protein [Phytohalomonas tamaricis]